MITSALRKTLVTIMAGGVLAAGVSMVTSTAQAADQGVRVRGTVIALSGDNLQVKSREGEGVTIKLDPKVMVAAVTKASINDIDKGDYVGIASMPEANGKDGALEVLIFPPQLKGKGEGRYGWDLQPKSMMTNATVSNAVKSVDGRTVTVGYHGQEKKISIPDGTPIVTLMPATTSDISPGTTVFVPATKDMNGSLMSNNVIVGKNGVVPPM